MTKKTTKRILTPAQHSDLASLLDYIIDTEYEDFVDQLQENDNDDLDGGDQQALIEYLEQPKTDHTDSMIGDLVDQAAENSGHVYGLACRIRELTRVSPKRAWTL